MGRPAVELAPLRRPTEGLAMSYDRWNARTGLAVYWLAVGAWLATPAAAQLPPELADALEAARSAAPPERATGSWLQGVLNARSATSPVSDERVVLARVWDGPYMSFQEARRCMGEALAAAAQAQQLSAAATVRTYGTLRQRPALPVAYDYSALPADRLEVIPQTGPKRTFRFHALEGQAAGAGNPAQIAELLEGSHNLDVQVRIGGRASLRLKSQSRRRGLSPLSDCHVAIGGWLLDQGRRYDVDLTATGTSFFENDRTGFERRLHLEYRGVLRVADFELTVDESWRAQSVRARRSVGDRLGGVVATTLARQLHTTWRVGERAYGFRGATTRVDLRDGKPTRWNAAGSVVRDGEGWGALESGGESRGSPSISRASRCASGRAMCSFYAPSPRRGRS